MPHPSATPTLPDTTGATCISCGAEAHPTLTAVNDCLAKLKAMSYPDADPMDH